MGDLKSLWDAGHAKQVGHFIYGAMRNSDRPFFAAAVLSFCRKLRQEVPAEVLHVESLARDPLRWKLAHEAFTSVRRLTLECQQRSEPDELRVVFLRVAECAAKVTFNASGADAPFDADCGAWLVFYLKSCVKFHAVPEVSDRALELLTDWMPLPGETSGLIPFSYGEFHDVPRQIYFQYEGKWYSLISEFDEERGDYTDYYRLYAFQKEAKDTASVDIYGANRPSIGDYIGNVPISQAGLDRTRRQTIDAAAFTYWLQKLKGTV